MKVKRGSLYAADLNPRFGSEPGKVRPVLVLQTDFINASHPSTIVCLLTTQVRPDVDLLRVHLKKGEAGIDRDSDVMIDQLRSIDNGRLKNEIGALSVSRLREIEEKVLIVLDLLKDGSQ